MFNLGPMEMVMFGVVALMLFGRKLPEVARNLGGSYRELRKGLSDFQREFQGWDRPDPRSYSAPVHHNEPEKLETSAPKFVPPSADNDSSGNKVDE